jgi:hypothetical protein
MLEIFDDHVRANFFEFPLARFGAPGFGERQSTMKSASAVTISASHGSQSP